MGSATQAKQDLLIRLLGGDPQQSIYAQNIDSVLTGVTPFTFHFTSADLSSSQNFIIIDLSDTTNYNHVATNYIRFDWLRITADAASNANYAIDLGFLENVDNTNGDFYSIIDFNSSKNTGNTISQFLNYGSKGHKCKSTFHTVKVDANNTAFQTDVNLASTLDPSTANVPSGNGDVALKVTVNAGSVIVSIEGDYHTL